MKRIIGFLLACIAIVGGIYFGGWICFCKPIAYLVMDIIGGSLSVTNIALALLKIFVLTPIIEIIAWITFLTGTNMMTDFF